MANNLSNSGIVDGQVIFANQVNQIIDAFTGVEAYDIALSGSLEVMGSINWQTAGDASGIPIEFVVRSTDGEGVGELYVTSSTAFDLKFSGSFPAERLVITENTSSANAGGLATSNNLRTFNNNNGIVIGGSEGGNGVNGLGLVISEDSGNGNHTIVSDGSGSNLNIRAAGGDEGDTYVVILSDQAGSDISDVFEIAKFGGPLRGTELYHTGSLVLNTSEIGANKAVIITGTISASAEAYLPGLANTTTPHIVGFDTASGQLTFYNTSSFGGGGSIDTGSLMVTGSVFSNTLTFTKGDGSTFDLTVNTGSGGGTINTGSFYISSSVSNATITFTQGDTTTEQVTVDNVNNAISASFALTSSHTPNALVTASLAGSNLTFTKGDSSQFTLALPGGGGGNPITGSYTGSLLTNNIQSIEFTGAGVLATVGGSNNITVDIPGGGSVNTGSLMVTGSVSSNTLTFTKGDGSTFDLTVDTGSATSINTGSFYISSSVSNATITFTQGDNTTETVTVDNVASASFATSASFAPNFYNSDGVITAPRIVTLDGENLTFETQNVGGFDINLFDTGSFSVNYIDDQSAFRITSSPTQTVSKLLGLDSNNRVVNMTTSSIQNVISSSFASTASFALTSSHTPEALVTASLAGSIFTFTKGDGSTFPLTINNVANATTAGSVLSNSTFAEDGVGFNVSASAGNTFTLLNINGSNIEAVAPKTVDDGSKILAVTTMEVYRSGSSNGFTSFEYRLFNVNQSITISGSTRSFVSNLPASDEIIIPTTFTFTVPISNDVTLGDTIELQVRTQPLTNSSASITYADLALVSITNA